MAKFKGYTSRVGYCWKLCPFSLSYNNRFYSRGYRGNTNNQDITDANFNSVVTVLHSYNDGTMTYYNRGSTPGWLCFDDSCQYFIDNGVRYFEF